MGNDKSTSDQTDHLLDKPSPIQRLAFACLIPLLVVQALWVRRSVPKLPEASGSRDGVAGVGKPLRLLVVGDSSAAGVGAPHQNQALVGCLLAALRGRFRVHWKLLARTGWTTPDLHRALHAEDASPFDVVLTATGLNDITARRSLAACLGEQIRLVDLLRKRWAVQQILISGMPPVHRFPSLPEPLRGCLGDRAKRLDKALQNWSRGQSDCDLVSLDFSLGPENMAPDGFHPGPEIYAWWARAAARHIISRWK